MEKINPNGVSERFAKHLDKPSQIAPSAYVHPRAVVIGDVTLAEESSVWPCAVLRGDINSIRIGRGSNVQDGAVLHLSDTHGVTLGAYVTVGHMAMVHACTVEDECLIGMNSIILDGAVIGTQSIVGAGALVTGNTVIPPGSLVLGSPAKVVRALTLEERADVKNWALKYVEVARGFKARGV